MTANLLTLENESAAVATPAAPPETKAAAATAENLRPAYLPEKFWDPEGKTVRLDAMAKSYGELERKLSGMMPGPQAPDFDQALRKALGVPEAPEAYRIELKDDLLQIDPEVNKRLHAAGFSRFPLNTSLCPLCSATRGTPPAPHRAAAGPSREIAARVGAASVGR